jgi:gliding motility-associated-like protein
LEVKTIEFPSIFTPSSGDDNAIFQPTNFLAGAEITEFVIFDRWGNLVYDYNKVPDDGKVKWWNGKFQNKNDQELASDVYVYQVKYIVKLKDGNLSGSKKGDITLIR